MKRLMMTAALVLAGSAASATISSDTVIKDLTAQGYSRIEIKRGLTQISVHAVRGREKLDMVLDTASGDVLRQSNGRVWFIDNTEPGVFVADRKHDFMAQDAVTVARGETAAAGQLSAVKPSSAFPVRLMEGAPDVTIDDGAFVEGEPVNIDGIGDGLPLPDDTGAGGQSIAIGEYNPGAEGEGDIGDGTDPLLDIMPYDPVITIDDGWVSQEPGEDVDPGENDSSDPADDGLMVDPAQ